MRVIKYKRVGTVLIVHPVVEKVILLIIQRECRHANVIVGEDLTRRENYCRYRLLLNSTMDSPFISYVYTPPVERRLDSE